MKNLASTAICITFITALTGGCFVKEAAERAKQLRTYANIQTITGRIEELHSKSSLVSDAQIAEIVHSVAEGRDQWGHPFVYDTKRNAEEFSYVVASLGRDGELDLSNIDEYYLASPESIDNLPDRDIVFVDGAPLKSAGK